MELLPNPNGQKNESRNLIFAVMLCGLALIGWDYFLGKNRVPTAEQTVTTAALVKAVTTPAAVNVAPVKASAPLQFTTSEFSATLDLTGSRISELTLNNFTHKKDGNINVDMLHSDGDFKYFDAGWHGFNGTKGPDSHSTWQVVNKNLKTNGDMEQLTLSFSNNQGQTFTRTITPEEDTFAFIINDIITNTATTTAQFSPYAQIRQQGGLPEGETSTFYNHIGPVGLVGDVRVETDFDDLETEDTLKKGKGHWWGISSQYFFSGLIPTAGTSNTFQFNAKPAPNSEKQIYSAIMQGDVVTVHPNQSVSYGYKLYSGPKQMKALIAADTELQNVVDYGWFHTIAKPIFDAIMWVNNHVGNLGVAIIIVTIGLKLALFPLATKSYKAMARMKKLQPLMAELKEKCGDDREALSMKMMELYRKHKVNPASGCWPVLIQIPIFFAMYKVMLLSFEFRQEPFMLWITDLSLKDPYYVLPIIMGISMFVQMRLNPPAADPVQQKVMQLMPIIFTFLFLMFPAGLVLYWVTNNVFSVAQQYIIMRRMGLHVDVAHMDMEPDSDKK